MSILACGIWRRSKKRKRSQRDKMKIDQERTEICYEIAKILQPHSLFCSITVTSQMLVQQWLMTGNCKEDFMNYMDHLFDDVEEACNLCRNVNEN